METLLGDPRKAHEKLGWAPTTTLEELVAEMVDVDREEARKEAILRLKGFKVVGSMENPPISSADSGKQEPGLMNRLITKEDRFCCRPSWYGWQCYLPSITTLGI